jgi:TolA-binding protein
MKKNILASVSAFALAGTLFVTASSVGFASQGKQVKKNVGKFKHSITVVQSKKDTSAAVKALEDQLKQIQKSEQDLITAVRQSDAYKQLETQLNTVKKSIIEQQLADGVISKNQATAQEAILTAAADTDLQTLVKTSNTTIQSIKALKTKYPKNADLIASADFKTLEAQEVTTLKAIIDRYVADGMLTADQATTLKTKVDTVVKNIDAGKTNYASLLNVLKLVRVK